MKLKSLFLFWILLACLWCTATQAQIIVNEVYQPFERIIAVCDLDVDEGVDVRYQWRSDLKDEQISVLEDGRLLHIWAQPGNHWLEVIVVTQKVRILEIPKFDPEDPKNWEKVTWEKVRVAESLDVSRYDSQFKVEGTAPGPGPDPGPTPDIPDTPDPPAPVAGFAGEVRKWLQAMPAGAYKKEIVVAIGDSYLSVGSQGSDPARNQGWSLDAFRTKTRDLNREAIEANGGEILQWDGFMRNLAQYQADLYAQRGLTTTSVAKIAELWTETGNALKAGAY